MVARLHGQFYATRLLQKSCQLHNPLLAGDHIECISDTLNAIFVSFMCSSYIIVLRLMNYISFNFAGCLKFASPSPEMIWGGSAGLLSADDFCLFSFIAFELALLEIQYYIGQNLILVFGPLRKYCLWSNEEFLIYLVFDTLFFNIVCH
jgi:hypothetical protein